MPVTQKEKNECLAFQTEIVDDLGSFKFDPETTLWHYTTGPGLIGILESGELFATQVACVNDSTEILYATRLYRDALLNLQSENADDKELVEFLAGILKVTAENPSTPSHSPSKFFITCFTTLEDDMSQWRAYGEQGGENGYAIGFRARGLYVGMNSAVAKVNYERTRHVAIARRIAEATVAFYRKGLEVEDRKNDPETWAREFFEIWDEYIYRIAPLSKDDGFVAENEFRIIHELQMTEIHRIRFHQKKSLMSRYISHNFPVWMGTRTPLLPIVAVMVGPSRQREISAVSVRTLLKQMGYGQSIPVSVSKRPLQTP